MRARLFLLLIFFILYSATSFMSSTSFAKLKSSQFSWSDDNIQIVGFILTVMQVFSIFLGGFLAAFIIPVWMLIVLCFSCLIIGITIVEADSFHLHSTMGDHKNFSSENCVSTVVAFFILFGIYSGMSKFIFLVMILDQDESTTIEDTMSSYLFCLNLSYLFAYILLPSSLKHDYLYISLPLILVAILLLLLGRWKNLYSLDSKQINIIGIIHQRFIKGDRNSIFSVKTELPHLETSSAENLASIHLKDSLENSTEAILSFSRLCIIFVTLLPYGICESQLRSTFVIQSNYLLQPNMDYYAMKSGFWVLVINCSGVVIFIPLIAVLMKSNNLFNKTFSNLMSRIITSNLLMILSILSAAIVETCRLNMYWGSRFSNIPSKHTRIQTINNITYSTADMSVFFMMPQLLFSSLSEILMITTCGQFMYQQSVGSIKHLSISFFLGAVGTGGAGDLISWGLTMLLNDKMFDPSDLNKRIFNNGTCCEFESRIDGWFYCLAIFFFVSVILTTIFLSKFKHFYQQQCSNTSSLQNETTDID